ncbi:MAG: guanylate kinase [bacterium]
MAVLSHLKKPTIFVVAAPSATGKTTMVEMLLNTMGDKLVRAITATSRPPREGEVHGEHYYFYPGGEFERKIKEDFFIEYVNVHGKNYGLPKHELERLLSSGKSPVLVIELEGILSIREKVSKDLYSKVVDIFLLPPSEEELVRRMKKRGAVSEEEIKTRLETMRVEMQNKDKFSHQVLNDDLDKAFQEVLRIVESNL